MRDILEQLLRATGVPNPERAEQLWAEYRAGGADANTAFATLIGWYGGAIYRRIWGFVRSDAADDVFQEVLVRLHRERAKLATFAHALRWLRTVASSQCVDAHRRATRRTARELVKAISVESSVPPEKQLELEEALRVALSKLSAEEQEAVALVFFEEMTRQDAAAAVGVHRDTFAKLLDGALAKMRTALATVGGAGGAVAVESALAARSPLPPARLAGLSATAWEKALEPVGAGLFSTSKVLAAVLVGGLVSVSLALTSRSPEMKTASPPQNRARLGLERLETREVPSFGTGGIVTADIGLTEGLPQRVARQADGKLITAGGTKVARFNTDGSLDATFDGDGILITRGLVLAMKVMGDGRIVVGGQSRVNDQEDFYLERFLPNGTPDPSFSGDGVVVTGFKTKGPAADDRIRGIALQGDGKIVAVGNINGTKWGVARFHVNGSLDTTFSGDGWLTDDFDRQRPNEPADAVAVQADGKIVVRGIAYRAATGNDVVVARYNANGTLDTSFGTGGKAWIDFGAEAGLPSTYEKSTETGSVQLDPSGNIVIDAFASMTPFGTVGIARLTSSGTLDTTFSGNGLFFALPTGWRGSDPSVTVQSDGKIVVTYRGIPTEPVDAHPLIDGHTLVGRINTDGSMDTAFDGDGWRTYGFAPINSSTPTDVLIQPDGKIVVVGWCHPAGTVLLGLARFNADGSFDAAP